MPARCRPGWSAAFYRFLEQIGEPIADVERAVRVDLAHVERLEREEAAERDQHVWDDLPPRADRPISCRTTHQASDRSIGFRSGGRRRRHCLAFELLSLPELEHVAAEQS